MKNIICLFIIFSLYNFNGFGENAIVDNIKDIEVSLNSEAEINNALFLIRQYDFKTFIKLKDLRKNNLKEFNIQLKKHYYSLLNTLSLEKKMKPKIKGYRKKVKESEILFDKLKNEYNSATNEQKVEIRKKLLSAASERYEIELELLKYHESQAKKFASSLEKKNGKFIKNKDKFINNIITKLLPLETKNKENEKK